MAVATTIGAGKAARRLGVSTQYLGVLAVSGRVAFIETPYGRAYEADEIERVRAEREAAGKGDDVPHR
jgi:hypothetical protein